MISSSIPFPPVSWWIYACREGQVTFDLGEHYQKMSYRNRYYLASPEGKTLMSIPIENGRNQRIPAGAVKISGTDKWQSNQWKTITSLYGRSPFFVSLEYQLRPLFEKQYAYLHDFNKEGISRICKLLGLSLDLQETTTYHKNYPGATTDIRESMVPQKANEALPEYYQVFAERCGFLPDCSILDLLFCEGLHALTYLKRNADKL